MIAEMQQERLRAAEEVKNTESVVVAEVTVGATGIEEASIGAEDE